MVSLSLMIRVKIVVVLLPCLKSNDWLGIILENPKDLLSLSIIFYSEMFEMVID